MIYVLSLEDIGYFAVSVPIPVSSVSSRRTPNASQAKIIINQAANNQAPVEAEMMAVN